MQASLRRTPLNKTILDALRKHSGQRTVLYVALSILDEHAQSLRAGKSCEGCLERDIVKVFRALAKQYGHSDYHPTYVQRRLGHGGFLELNGSRYRFRTALMSDVTADQLGALRDELILSLKTAFERRQAVIKQLEETIGLPHDRIQERRALVGSYLDQIAGNSGEMFEVVSFAVLREYFRTFGFSLQRFSTTHANDGGMDFVAGEAIYQVTTDESANKVRKDLAKSPGTKRVLVRPTVNDEIIQLCDAEVLETIELKDLLDHFIAWLLARDARSRKARHLQQILQIALSEFRRENKARKQVHMIARHLSAMLGGAMLAVTRHSPRLHRKRGRPRMRWRARRGYSRPSRMRRALETARGIILATCA